MASILARIPVVAGVAYREHVRALPASFTVTASVRRSMSNVPISAMSSAASLIARIKSEVSDRS